MMNSCLNDLKNLTIPELWALFLIENLFIAISVIVVGGWIMKGYNKGPVAVTSKQDWLLCGGTILLNTIVTYTGFWLWQQGIIAIDENLSWKTVIDFFILFFAMDFLMYVFHFAIHHTFLYNVIHSLHHEAVDPKPIDLFVLHPVETLAFGGLWLLLLMTHSYSLIAIALYLTVNVFFGLIGHLGIEPLPVSWKKTLLFQYLGTSTFHHDHHKDVHVNFGFYTSIWDRLFGTLEKSVKN